MISLSRTPNYLHCVRIAQCGILELSQKNMTGYYSFGTRIYQEKGTFELMRNLLIYWLMKPILVKNASKMLDLSIRILGAKPTYFLLKQTIGKVFMAGENYKELKESQNKYRKHSIHSITDYGCEGVSVASTEVLENNLNNYLQTLQDAALQKRDTIAIKVTGFATLPLLRELNIAQQKLNQIFSDISPLEPISYITTDQLKDYLETKLNIFPTEKEFKELMDVIHADVPCPDPCQIRSIEFYANVHAYPIDNRFKCSILERIAGLSDESQEQLNEVGNKMKVIAEEAIRLKTGVMIDAEQTFIQDAISSLTRQLQFLYNSEKALILNTYQAYLRTTMSLVQLDMGSCKLKGVPFGIKLVRGAYVTEENILAERAKVQSPILDSAEETSTSYNACVEYIISNLPPNSQFSVCSHNGTSLEIAVDAIERNKEKLGTSVVSFAQLKGLGEKLTFDMAKKGYYSLKYMPFGPTPILAQYLLRRAEEASYISRESQEMKNAIIHELVRYRLPTILAFCFAAAGLFLYFKRKSDKKSDHNEKAK